MEARTLIPLPSPSDPESATARVRVDGDRIVVDRLVIHDPTLAAFLGERPADDRDAIVERALRIGLIALQDAGVTVNVDVVRSGVREAGPPDRIGQREGRPDPRADAPV